MIPVDKFLEEQENKPVYFELYSYYDTTLDQFNQIVVEDKEPAFMAESIRAGLLKGTFPAEKAAGLIFVHLGRFDMKSGKFEIFDEPRAIVDCDRLLAKKGEAA